MQGLTNDIIELGFMVVEELIIRVNYGKVINIGDEAMDLLNCVLLLRCVAR